RREPRDRSAAPEACRAIGACTADPATVRVPPTDQCRTQHDRTPPREASRSNLRPPPPARRYPNASSTATYHVWYVNGTGVDPDVEPGNGTLNYVRSPSESGGEKVNHFQVLDESGRPGVAPATSSLGR